MVGQQCQLNDCGWDGDAVVAVAREWEVWTCKMVILESITLNEILAGLDLESYNIIIKTAIRKLSLWPLKSVWAMFPIDLLSILHL